MGEVEKQMSLIDETTEVIKFLEQVGKNSIITDNAMHCRLSACNNLFSVLREGETTVDYVLENLPLLVSRFRKKNQNVSAGTLKVYKSRVKSSLEDFREWSRNPLEWEKSVIEKSESSKREKQGKQKAKQEKTPPKNGAHPTSYSSTDRKLGRRVCFPLREDFDVEVVIPPDGLTAKELLKLELFLYPFCKDIGHRDESVGWPPLSTSKH